MHSDTIEDVLGLHSDVRPERIRRHGPGDLSRDILQALRRYSGGLLLSSIITLPVQKGSKTQSSVEALAWRDAHVYN